MNFFVKIFCLIFLFPLNTFCQEVSTISGKPAPRTPFLQLSAGMVYSSIDLSRYTGSVSYRGNHLRIVTHLKGLFFVSAEYSVFKIHNAPSAWKDISTRKFDLNTHVSFATNNNLTRIFALGGINQHEWHATRTGFTDQSQLGWGIAEGEMVNVNRWGVNFGCGFTQTLYENIGIFGDYRFCFAQSTGFEKVRIMDVMTTLGLNISFPYPERSKKYGIAGKLYKWTKKGGKK